MPKKKRKLTWTAETMTRGAINILTSGDWKTHQKVEQMGDWLNIRIHRQVSEMIERLYLTNITFYNLNRSKWERDITEKDKIATYFKRFTDGPGGKPVAKLMLYGATNVVLTDEACILSLVRRTRPESWLAAKLPDLILILNSIVESCTH